MRPLDLPRVGRYRLYDLSPPAHVICRLCPRRKARRRMDHAWAHAALHYRRGGCHSPALCAAVPEVYCPARDGLAARLILVMTRRRSDRNRRHGQYEYATGGEPWSER